MVSPHRKYRAAFGLAIGAQATLLGMVYYLNCGATTPILSLPACQPWFPDSLLPFLPSLRALGEPGFSLVPSFYLSHSLPVPGWLHEWAWMIVVGSANVVVWTVGLGSALVAMARLLKGAGWRGRQTPA